MGTDKVVYPWDDLEVDHCFLIKDKDRKEKVRSRLGHLNHSKKKTCRFELREFDAEWAQKYGLTNYPEGGWGVWRVK